MDKKFHVQLTNSGYVHRPLPLMSERSFEHYAKKKNVLHIQNINAMDDLANWSHNGVGELIMTPDKRLRLTSKPKYPQWPEGEDGDYSNFGTVQATFHLGGQNWEHCNRLSFRIFPDCPGMMNPHMSVSFENDGLLKIPDEYFREGVHYINLINRQWNDCFLEISELPRDKMTKIHFSYLVNGYDRTTGEYHQFDVCDIRLETIDDPEVVSGWLPVKDRVIVSTTGYHTTGCKIALANTDESVFSVIDHITGQYVFSGAVKKVKHIQNEIGVLDFSGLRKKGEFRIQMGKDSTPFWIGDDADIWEESIWRSINFIFCERCGFPVPEKHGSCHGDIIAQHNGLMLAYTGGWHDAGDVSQQTLQTAEVAFALLEAAQAYAFKKDLSLRLLEEAEWGLDFVLKCRFGDGYRATSAGITIWSDGLIGNMDDMKARVHNNSFENFLSAGIEAYASAVLVGSPMLQEKLREAAKQDFGFAKEHFEQNGYGELPIMWEHSYNTSESQFMATASWAASMIYSVTGDEYYAAQAAEFVEFVLACQRTEPICGAYEVNGFFYRDKTQNVIQHFNHQSRDSVFMQALTALCETQPKHERFAAWENGIRLYAGYLKTLMAIGYPYGMIPAGIYHIHEAQDNDSFERQHLFPGEHAKEDYVAQVKQGVQVDEEHYIKFFPVWFSFRGNTAIHLTMGKSAAICGKYLDDPELMEIAREQLYWTVGKNPFGQSLMYGEGYNFCQLYAVLPGEMAGELPVGIQTKYNEDTPYWPQANNATYKEVWLTSAGKWLSLVAGII